MKPMKLTARNYFIPKAERNYMSASEVAAYTKRTFGKQPCSECAKKAQEG